MEKTSVPHDFLCPISLEVMKDPVITSSGVTYDRSRIENWMDNGNTSCPVTMQPIVDASGSRYLVPNLALRRLIRSWCERNGRSPPRGSRSPSPDVVSRERAFELVQSLHRHDLDPGPSLRELRTKARESSRSARAIAKAGAVQSLASIVCTESLGLSYKEEAVRALALLPTEGDGGRRALVTPKALHSIARVLREGSPQGRVAAAALLEALARDRGAQIAIGATPGVFQGLFAMLRRGEREVAAATMATTALRALLSICGPTRNRASATASGGVAAIVELLPDSDGATAEHALVVLELLCSCDEGRSAAASHALALPVVVKKMLRVSDSATDHAVGVVWSICCSRGDFREIRENIRGLGLFGKLLTLLRRDMSPGTRRKVIDILDKVYNAKMDYDSIGGAAVDD